MEDIKPTTESPVVEVTTETVTEPQTVETTPATQESQPGSKTDPVLLLRSLKEEREKRRELEEQVRTLQTYQPPQEAFSDEGRLLESKIKKLEEELAVKDAIAEFPALKDKKSEFDEFRKTYPGLPITSVAKVFMAENGMFAQATERKGLEPASGGTRTPAKSGMSAEEVADLRVNNPRKWLKMLQSGQIKIQD